MPPSTFLRRGPRVAIRHVTAGDHAEIDALTRLSADLHHPWVPARGTTREDFAEYLARFELPAHEGFVICLSGTGRIVGAVNINNIVRGSRQSGTLGQALPGRSSRARDDSYGTSLRCRSRPSTPSTRTILRLAMHRI